MVALPRLLFTSGCTSHPTLLFPVSHHLPSLWFLGSRLHNEEQGVFPTGLRTQLGKGTMTPAFLPQVSSPAHKHVCKEGHPGGMQGGHSGEENMARKKHS